MDQDQPRDAPLEGVIASVSLGYESLAAARAVVPALRAAVGPSLPIEAREYTRIEGAFAAVSVVVDHPNGHPAALFGAKSPGLQAIKAALGIEATGARSFRVTSGLVGERGTFRWPPALWHTLASAGCSFGHDLMPWEYKAPTKDGSFRVEVHAGGARLASAEILRSDCRGAAIALVEDLLRRLRREGRRGMRIHLESSPNDGQGGYGFLPASVQSIAALECEVVVTVP